MRILGSSCARCLEREDSKEKERRGRDIIAAFQHIPCYLCAIGLHAKFLNSWAAAASLLWSNGNRWCGLTDEVYERRRLCCVGRWLQEADQSWGVRLSEWAAGTRWGCQPINSSNQSHPEREREKEREKRDVDHVWNLKKNNLQNAIREFSIIILLDRYGTPPFSCLLLLNCIKCNSYNQ